MVGLPPPIRLVGVSTKTLQTFWEKFELYVRPLRSIESTRYGQADYRLICQIMPWRWWFWLIVETFPNAGGTAVWVKVGDGYKVNTKGLWQGLCVMLQGLPVQLNFYSFSLITLSLYSYFVCTYVWPWMDFIFCKWGKGGGGLLISFSRCNNLINMVCCLWIKWGAFGDREACRLLKFYSVLSLQSGFIPISF
jgi:hypothetical protein